jgi:hypothetical protein
LFVQLAGSSFVEEEREKPKELIIKDTRYVYDVIKIDIGLEGYGAAKYKV